MATVWPEKAPSEVREYKWKPDLPLGDFVSDAAIVVDAGGVSAVLVNDFDRQSTPDEVRFDVSGGTAGTQAQVTITVTSVEARKYVETFVIPVRDGVNEYTATGRDIANFAMRKVVGIEGSPTAAEMDTALEVLDALVATWRGKGLDLGIQGKIAAADTIAVPETFIPALKYNLTKWLAEEFERPLTQNLMMMAQETEDALRAQLVEPMDMQFEAPLLRKRMGWGFERGFS